MKKNFMHPAMLLAAIAVWGSSPMAVLAQNATTWNGATELSFVSTGGNASSSTLGLKASLVGTMASSSVKLEVGSVRGESTFTRRTATGTSSSFTVAETEESQLTAESYFARARYDRTIGAAFGFVGTGWDRNTFAGIGNRFAFVAGLGKVWVEAETGRLKTDIGATYTIQKDVDPEPGADEGFGGVRFSVEASRRLSDATELTSQLVVDENLENTDDARADWTNSLSVSLSDRLALKTSLQILFDNQPSRLPVPLVDGAGVPTGTTVLTPGKKADNVFTLTLVIKL